jgi:hypothetical protein
LVECGWRHETGRVDCDYRRLTSGGNSFSLPLGNEGRLVLQHDGSGFGCKAVYQALLSLGCTINILDAGKSALLAPGRHITARA